MAKKFISPKMLRKYETVCPKCGHKSYNDRTIFIDDEEIESLKTDGYIKIKDIIIQKYSFNDNPNVKIETHKFEE